MDVKNIRPMSPPLDVPRGTFTRAEIRIFVGVLSFAGLVVAVFWPVETHKEAAVKGLIVSYQAAVFLLMLASWRGKE